MADPTLPNRDQIAAIVGNNPRLVIAFTRLFEVAGDETPADLLELILDGAIANDRANEAIAAINRLSNAIELATLAPKSEDEDVFDDTTPTLTFGQDVFDDTAPRAELGTIASQNREKVDITGGTLDSVDIDNSTFDAGTLNNDTITGSIFSGGSVASTVTDSTTRLIRSNVVLNDNTGAAAGTLTNAPTAGDPSKWIQIDDSGTIRFIPTWI